MEEAISERAISLIVMVLRVKLIKTVPTELVFALDALHKFTATRTYNTHLTFRADLGREQFIKIAENSQLSYIEYFL